jgi:predicted RNase H-like HicB family nuclease
LPGCIAQGEAMSRAGRRIGEAIADFYWLLYEMIEILE